MKVKVLSRNPDEYVRETKRDIHKVQRNYDPNLHPFEIPREYTRAVNAVKLERVFAKPFLGCLDGHKDVVQCLKRHPTSLSHVLSGSCDGQIKLWNLPTRKCFFSTVAHDGIVRGVTFHPAGTSFFSCGSDKTIKKWNAVDFSDEPMTTILGETNYQTIDHHWSDDSFATGGEQVDLWDESRTVPIRSFQWGVDSIHNVRFNPVEKHILGGCASDRSITLYDIRGGAAMRKVVLKMISNTMAWNPMEPFIFTVANEDYNLYTFDIRKFTSPLLAHMDHTLAVIDCDYSPTGKEIVSGSYDKTLRIFDVTQVKSREVYYTKRMQRISCVQWSGDDKFILCGSDEMNIRLWKAHASEKLGALRPREKEAFRYNDKLKEKFKMHPQVSRIARHRHVPKTIVKAKIELAAIRHAQRRKERNMQETSKKGTVKRKSHKEKAVVEEVG